MAGQAPQIAQGAVGGIQQIQGWLQGPPFNLGASQIGEYVQAADQRLQQSAGQIATGVLTGLTTVANSVINAVLALVLAFLFVKDGPKFLPWVRRTAGPTSGDHLAEVGARSWLRLGGFIRWQALIGFVDAVFIGIGLVIFGVPLALPLAVLTFFGAFIPIIGALVAGALAVLIALVIQGPATALGVLILILVVQQVEGNLLQPLVQGRGLGLNSALVILAVTAGSSLAGIAGAFLAVPVAAVIAEILRYFGEQIDRRTGEHEEGAGDVALRGDESPGDGSAAGEADLGRGDDHRGGRRGAGRRDGGRLRRRHRAFALPRHRRLSSRVGRSAGQRVSGRPRVPDQRHGLVAPHPRHDRDADQHDGGDEDHRAAERGQGADHGTGHEDDAPGGGQAGEPGDQQPDRGGELDDTDRHRQPRPDPHHREPLDDRRVERDLPERGEQVQGGQQDLEHAEGPAGLSPQVFWSRPE